MSHISEDGEIRVVIARPKQDKENDFIDSWGSCTLMNRKEYMKKVYSLDWLTLVKKHGFSDYNRKLCNLIQKIVPEGKILDVGVGTGYPFASYLSSKGYDTYGIDIAENLVEKCNADFPRVKAFVGDAENIEFIDNYFDAVYCFRSTWYFTDILKAINEMIRVTKNRGYVFFDIMNADSKEVKIAQIRAKTFRRFIGVISRVMRVIIGEKTVLTLHLRETPISASYLSKYFIENQIDYVCASSDSFVFSKEIMSNKRLIYIISKHECSHKSHFQK